MRLRVKEVRMITLRSSQTQGLLNTLPLILLLAQGWEIEAVLPVAAYEWHLILTVKKWFWEV